VTAFELISVAYSIVVGLGVTVVLTSLVRVFRSRREIRLDWIPLVWATCILVIQFQSLWAVIALRNTVDEWSFISYALLVFQALMLFLAGALVLPGDSVDYPRSLRTYFEQDGKWSVAALAVQIGVAGFANVTLWSTPLSNPTYILMAVLIALCVAFLQTSSRRLAAVTTAMFGILTAVAVLTASVGSFQ
jgi:hypothetical protein